MQFFGTIVCTIAIILSIRTKEKKWHILLFNLMWIILFLVSSIGINGIIVPSQLTYTYLFIFILSYNLGALVFNNLKSKKYISRINQGVIYHIINEKLFLLINIISIIYFFNKYTINSLRILKQYGAAVLRYYAFNSNEEFFGSTFDLIIAQYFIQAIFFSSALIAVIRLIDLRKFDKIVLVGVTGLILYSITFQSRDLFLAMGIFAVLSYMIDSKQSKRISKNRIIGKSKKGKFAIIALIALFGVFIYVITKERSGAIYSLQETLTIYLFGSLSLMEVFISNRIGNQYPFRIFLSGLTDPIIVVFTKAFGFYDKTLLGNYLLNSTISISHPIGGGLMMNAGTTAVHQLLMDFGLGTVVLVGIIFGGASSAIHNNYKKTKSKFWLAIYLLIIYAAYATKGGWIFRQTYFCLSFFVVKFFYLKKTEI